MPVTRRSRRNRGNQTRATGRGSPQEDLPVRRGLTEALDLLRILWAINHAMSSISKRMETAIGITGPQRIVIRILGQFPRATAAELAHVLHFHPSTITGILQRLEERRLIDRELDSEDRRRSFFVLTERGRTFDVDDPNSIESAARAVLDSTPPTEFLAAARVLTVLRQELESRLGVMSEEPKSAPASTRRAR